MITHASVARALAENRSTGKFPREVLDFMKQVEGGITRAIRIRAMTSSVSTEGTSVMAVTAVRALLDELGYKTSTRPIGQTTYLFIDWKAEPPTEPTQPQAA